MDLLTINVWRPPRKIPRIVVEFVTRRRRTDEREPVQRRTNHRDFARGLKTAEVCRRHGIAEATLYKWKAKYGGMEVADAKRIKGLEDENRRLKKLLAEAMLDNAALKDILGKNV